MAIYGLGIEVFLAVVRSGNLIRASKELNLSQSTMSYRLDELEQGVGDLLIDRHRGQRTIHLTPTGKRFLALAERWEALRQEMLQWSDDITPVLSIGAVDSLNAFVLPPIYRLMRQVYPRLQLRLCTQRSTRLYTLIERHKLDMAFVLHEQTDPNVILVPFWVDPMVLIRPGAAQVQPETIDPRALDPRSEIYFKWSGQFQSWHDYWWDPRNAPLMILDTAQLILAFMNCPERWAIVPQSMAEALVATGDFTMAGLTEPPPDRVCYRIEPKVPRVGSQPGLELFRECAQTFREQPSLMHAFSPILLPMMFPGSGP